jgi:uncharacterized protein
MKEASLRLVGGDRIYSATDLTNFLACPHLTRLQLDRLEGRIEAAPERPASTADLAVQRGHEHERRHLELMLDRFGDDLVEVQNDASDEGLATAVDETAAAMRAGSPLIYQAAFLQDRWMGYADFLERVDAPSDLGPWSYIALDTKYARSVKPYFVLQLCLYSELIAGVQGTLPPRIELILGDDRRITLPTSDFHAYFARMKGRFLATVDAPLAETYPTPVAHCEICDWAEPCEERRVGDDHLSQVAKLGAAQTRKLNAAGVDTVAGLAIATDDLRPTGMSVPTFENLRTQAGLQVSERESGEKAHVLLRPHLIGEEPPRGFGLLSQPSPGDLFFDIEGDPFYDDGLEYLWGVSFVEASEQQFRVFLGAQPSRGEEGLRGLRRLRLRAARALPGSSRLPLRALRAHRARETDGQVRIAGGRGRHSFPRAGPSRPLPGRGAVDDDLAAELLPQGGRALLRPGPRRGGQAGRRLRAPLRAVARSE